MMWIEGGSKNGLRGFVGGQVEEGRILVTLEELINVV
jgi:hypothetical protein